MRTLRHAYQHRLRILTARSRAVAVTFSGVSPHSQITNTRQPSSSRREVFRLSLATLSENFRCQNSTLLFGVAAILHPSWRCQKQPCTKITTLCRRITKSGLPGKSFTCKRYRKPMPCKALRKANSGTVSFPRMRAIRMDRSAGVRKSTIGHVPSGQ